MNRVTILTMIPLITTSYLNIFRVKSFRINPFQFSFQCLSQYRTKPTLKSKQKSDVEKESRPQSEKDRPFTLPSGDFRPKQSLGQNFLSDQNYVLKIVDSFRSTIATGSSHAEDDGGRKIIEIGPGPGALSRVLHQRYPNMTAIEIDQRAVKFLSEKLPALSVLEMDVLEADWAALARERGGPVSVIANLPYYIVSQVLFSLADAHESVSVAVVTMQLEVAERLCAQPRSKQYGIPSVVFQLYGHVTANFKIPPTVFYPVPKVDSALVTIDFSCPHRDLHSVSGAKLRRVVSTAFRQRRKMLRQSLKELLQEPEVRSLPEHWACLRPEQLRPEQFLQLTRDLYGLADPAAPSDSAVWRRGGGVAALETLPP